MYLGEFLLYQMILNVCRFFLELRFLRSQLTNHFFQETFPDPFLCPYMFFFSLFVLPIDCILLEDRDSLIYIHLSK